MIFINVKKTNINRFIVSSLSFSLSIMFFLSIIELLPSSIYSILSHFNYASALTIIITTLMIGFIFITLLNKLFKDNTSDLYKVGLLSATALFIHNIPEGIATFITSYANTTLGIKLAVAIALHNIPEGISIAVPIYYATKKKSRAIVVALLSGLSEPLAGIISFIFIKDYITGSLINIILLFVGSIMITLSINHLLPKAKKYKEPKHLKIGFIIGFIIIFASYLFNLI